VQPKISRQFFASIAKKEPTVQHNQLTPAVFGKKCNKAQAEKSRDNDIMKE